MAEITLDGARVTLCALTIPRVGAWVADLDVDSAEAITGRVSLVIDGATWSGTVARGGLVAGSWRGRIVGGAGGLSGTLGAVAQRGSTLGTVLADALLAAGETLSNDAHDLGALANLWHRIAGPASTAVADVARAAGYSWRTLADGSVWLGADAWATYTPTGAVDVIDEQPEAGRLVLAGDTLGVLPGQTLALPGRDAVRVGQVEHRATPSDLRTVVLADGATGLGGVVDAVIRRALRRVDYLALYPARVVSQSAAGLLDLVPDDARVPPCSGVPIRYGLPGVTAVVPAGERVTLTYEGGDPSKPVATLWTAGTMASAAVNGSTRQAARTDDTTADGTLVFSCSSGTPSPGLTTMTITYTPPGGAPQAVGIVLTGAASLVGPSTLTLSGKITGTSVLRA
jgi:hypothetical protein